MKAQLLTLLTTGCFVGAALGLIVYIVKRDPTTALLAGAFGGFIAGCAAAAFSAYIDQRVPDAADQTPERADDEGHSAG